MTINNMIEQGIQLQGAYVIKHWNDETETYNVLTEGSMFEDERTDIVECSDLEILYMYCADNKLMIEV